MDTKTGRTVWQQNEDSGYDAASRPDGHGGQDNPTYIGSWSTPVLMPVGGVDQLLLSWPRRLAAYDPQTGRELWTCRGLNPLVYTSPIYGDGTVLVAVSTRQRELCLAGLQCRAVGKENASRG